MPPNDAGSHTTTPPAATPPATAPAPVKPTSLPVIDDSEFALLLDTDRFAQIQRVAKLYSESDFVTDAYRGKIANCAIALQSSMRLRVDPVMFMQHSYLVHGKPGIEGQLVIALINARGPFTGPLQWKSEGEGAERKWTCYATHKKTGELCQRTITWAIVEAEGWAKKDGSKWKTMPDQMGCYRSASWFGRLYCPEVLLGFPTTDELEDIGEREVRGERLVDETPINLPQPRTDAPATPAVIDATPATGNGEQPAAQQAQGQAAATQPAEPKPTLNKPASEAQRKMILGIAEKHGKLTAAQLDEKLTEKFAVTLSQLPMGMVNDAIAFVRELQPS